MMREAVVIEVVDGGMTVIVTVAYATIARLFSLIFC